MLTGLTLTSPGLNTHLRALEDAADKISAAMALHACGGKLSDPVLETSLAPLSLTYDGAGAVVAVCGAVRRVTYNDREIPNAAPVTLTTGDRLDLGPVTSGAHSYIALSDAPASSSALTHWASPPATSQVLHITAGPQAGILDGGLSGFCQTVWQASGHTSRMGIRLTGPKIDVPRQGSLSTSGVFPGTLQLPPDGQPLLLGIDCGVTGGYPVIASVIRADRPNMGQIAPGTRVYFKPVTRTQAVEILRDRTRWLRGAMPRFQF